MIKEQNGGKIILVSANQQYVSLIICDIELQHSILFQTQN